jgi:molecular chaperone GrpE (heat shock protein)
MRAADVTEESTVAPGTVIEVFRPGYAVNGRIVRYAEVKVAGTRSDGRTTSA